MSELSARNQFYRKKQIELLAINFDQISKSPSFQSKVIELVSNRPEDLIYNVFLQEVGSNYFFLEGWRVKPRYSAEESREIFREFVFEGNNNHAGDMYMIAKSIQRDFSDQRLGSAKKDLDRICNETGLIATGVSKGFNANAALDKVMYQRFARLFLSGEIECLQYAAQVVTTTFSQDMIDELEHQKQRSIKNNIATLLIGKDRFDESYLHAQLITPHPYLVEQQRTGFFDKSKKSKFKRKKHLRLVWDKSKISS